MIYRKNPGCPGLKHTLTKDNVMITSVEAPDLNRNDLLKYYDMLNKSGKGKAVEQVKMLTKIPEYQKKSPASED